MIDLATSVNTPKKAKLVDSPTRDEVPEDEVNITPFYASTPNEQSSSTFYQTLQCELCKQLGPKPAPVEGKEWVPFCIWTLKDPNTSEIVANFSNSTQSLPNKTFEQLTLDKMKGPVERPVIKRRKIDRKAKVITDNEYLEELKAMENGKKKPNKTKVKSQKR